LLDLTQLTDDHGFIVCIPEGVESLVKFVHCYDFG
jgi:hypothetical protein